MKELPNFDDIPTPAARTTRPMRGAGTAVAVHVAPTYQPEPEPEELDDTPPDFDEADDTQATAEEPPRRRGMDYSIESAADMMARWLLKSLQDMPARNKKGSAPGVSFDEQYIKDVLSVFTSRPEMSQEVADVLIRRTLENGCVMFRAPADPDGPQRFFLMQVVALDKNCPELTELPSEDRATGNKIGAVFSKAEQVRLSRLADVMGGKGSADVIRTGVDLMAKLAEAGIDPENLTSDALKRLKVGG